MGMPAPKTCKELLEEYKNKHKEKSIPSGELLVFDVKGDLHIISEKFKKYCPDPKKIAAEITIYNPTKPIRHEVNSYLIGRVEPRKEEGSKIMFFVEKNHKWRVLENAPVLNLEDPFYNRDIQGWKIIGGVNIHHDPSALERICYETVFYRYKNTPLELIENDKLIQPFATGPKGMKDIRLIELENGNVGVFTRPQGGTAGYGKIGFVEIEKIDQLEGKIPDAKIIEGMFHPDEWGGANELHLLKNGKIGVLGHIAHFDGDVRHYYAMSFVFGPKKFEYTHPEILTTADDFPSVEPRNSSLGKVVFSGGLERNSDGTAYLYVGIGDVNAGRIKIKDPFLKYENIIQK